MKREELVRLKPAMTIIVREFGRSYYNYIPALYIGPTDHNTYHVQIEKESWPKDLGFFGGKDHYVYADQISLNLKRHPI